MEYIIFLLLPDLRTDRSGKLLIRCSLESSNEIETKGKKLKSDKNTEISGKGGQTKLITH